MGFISDIYTPSVKKYRGFTLIELLVAIIIFATLSLIVINLFNPLGQLTKGRNAHRQQDLDQIRSALDIYYNDNGCYPSSIPFGAKWSSGSTVYMQKVPQDVHCNAATGICYLYETDSSTCPQWNILYATLEPPINTATTTCKLSGEDSCKPTGFDASGVNYCIMSGNIDCNYVSTNALPVGPFSPPTPNTPTPTPGSRPTSTPTPVVYPTCAPKNFDCRAGLCNRVANGTGNYCVANCSCACNAQCN